MILTLACGKYRFNKRISATSAAFRGCWTSASAMTPTRPCRSPWPWPRPSSCGVNDLPLSLVLSWYEQKAVAILLTLLHLGIRNIRLGPVLPAFVTPNVLKVLVENFDIMPITTPDADLKAILGAEAVQPRGGAGKAAAAGRKVATTGHCFFSAGTYTKLRSNK